jgi:hypothetical protein
MPWRLFRKKKGSSEDNQKIIAECDYRRQLQPRRRPSAVHTRRATALPARAARGPIVGATRRISMAEPEKYHPLKCSGGDSN